MFRAALVLIALFGPSAFAAATLPVGGRPGYLESVREERDLKEEEVVLIGSPSEVQAERRPFVDAKLRKEFQTQYELKFGHTDAERVYNSTNQFALYDYPGGKQETIAAHEDNQLKFGNYMFRRLAETHVDQYAKSNPDIRPIYELKDRISHVNVEVKKGYKVKLNYSYSGNYLDVKVDNPYEVDTKLSLRMHEGFGPGRIEKSILSLGFALSPKTSVAAHEEWDNAASTTLVGTRRLSRTLSTSLSTSVHTPVDRDVPLGPRHDMVLVGFTWTE